jgi:hypothetical protein
VVGGAEAVGDLTGDAGVGLAQLLGPLGDLVLGEGAGQRAEGVGLDDVGADLEVGRVEGGDDIGPGDGEQLRAALVVLAAVVVGVEVLGLQPRAGGPVVDDDVLVDRVEEGGSAHG